MVEQAQQHIRLDRPVAGVARVTLARAEARNAQSPDLLYQFDAALTQAAADDEVRVIVIAADGPDFSAGHDLKAGSAMPCAPVATMSGGFGAPGIEGYYSFECEAYLGLCRRWRELPKPTVVAVQGRVIAGGLMLVWPFDLIVASEDATFSDPVTAFGVNGVEYFAHAFELPMRRAKEILFTGEAVGAEEAHRIGMVNHVVPRDRLETATLELAGRIAQRPPFGLQLAKTSVNRSQDAQGFQQALDNAFALHALSHANCLARYGMLMDPSGAQIIRDMSKKPDPSRLS